MSHHMVAVSSYPLSLGVVDAPVRAGKRLAAFILAVTCNEFRVHVGIWYVALRSSIYSWSPRSWRMRVIW